MTKKEFIKEIRTLADQLEKNDFHFINLDGDGYIFGNKNYGEVSIPLIKGTRLAVSLFTSSEEEKNV